MCVRVRVRVCVCVCVSIFDTLILVSYWSFIPAGGVSRALHQGGAVWLPWLQHDRIRGGAAIDQTIDQAID